jgi:glycosyltransferase involved in cell wall biosynthesis
MNQPIFKNVTVILPVMNETFSLTKTVDTIRRDVEADVCEYIFVVCKKTETESRRICEQYVASNPSLFFLHDQKLPFLGGAVREAFDLAKGSHVILMSSDLETDPNDVKTMVEKSKKNPAAIITASRWRIKEGFHGYSPFKLILNYFFQRLVSVLYRTRLSDATYGYRLFPTALVQSIAWEELRHPFLLETILKPLRLGVAVEEIPSHWAARQEGVSQNSLFKTFDYVRVMLRLRLIPVERILKK